MKIKLLLYIAVLVSLNACEKNYEMHISSNSMLPTYKKGSTVKVTRINKTTSNDYLCRGCLVVYTRKSSSGETNLYLHRVIAIQNDTFEYNSTDDNFTVNNKKTEKNLTEKFETNAEGVKKINLLSIEKIDSKKYSVQSEENFNLIQTASAMVGDLQSQQYPLLTDKDCKILTQTMKCKVPLNYVFVIGDNRANSLLGFVPIANIVGYIE